ncbi:uncharacterized protein LOC118247801 [Cygnus atratus]|uniref:uncharacterized protein LOC118247801 n=1 Tax=Cygnus atratus TaxID=8868 RepID=UPI0015D57AD9|nr:uncharacterized protein LOC118247801 [Cygnus atratus]
MCLRREQVGVAEVVEGVQFVNTGARKPVIYNAAGRRCPPCGGGCGGGSGSRGPAIKGKGPGAARCGGTGREGSGEGAGGLCREERRHPAGCPSVLPEESRAAPPSPSRREAAAHRGGAAAAASSCGTGRRCQEPGERRWQCRSQEQKLAEIMFCIQENEESVLMTKHRNLENHRIPRKPWRMEQTQSWSLKSSWNLYMGSYPDFGQLICGDWSAHQEGTSARRSCWTNAVDRSAQNL